MYLRTLLLFVVLLVPVGTSAQTMVESAGSRALGMGGAFVGVADDSTAAHWNPAGLATGPQAGMTIGWVDFRSGNQDGLPAPGPTHRTSKFVSLGTWPLAISYGTFQETRVAEDLSRGVHTESTQLSHFGATIVQTLTPGLVLGSTVKYLRGSAVSGPINGLSARDALSAGEDLEASSSGAFDLDIGLMADLGKARVGLTMRNLREPTFSDGAGTALSLRRQSRIGLAVFPVRGLTLAMDLDLDTVALRDGPRRILAFGVEQRLGTRWALRAGTRRSLEGARRTVAAVGGSVAMRRSLWLDWHYTSGGIDADRGFGVALRVGS
jgi:hypothetical protein